MKLKVDHSRIPCRGQKARHIEVRADANTRRRIVLAHVGEEEQHEQRAVPRRNIDTPCRVVAPLRIAGLSGEAEIDMPSEAAGVVWRRKAHDEPPNIKT